MYVASVGQILVGTIDAKSPKEHAVPGEIPFKALMAPR
jgi:hypothetical protein